MAFEFQQMSVEDDFTKTHKLLYGEPGTGKTTFAAHMTSSEGKPPYFIMTEKGNGILRPWGQQVGHWDGFIKLRDILLGPKKQEALDKFGCLVFDVIGDFEDMAAKKAAELTKVQHIADLPHGKGWVLHEEVLRAGIQPLMQLLPCVFIAHVKDKIISVEGKDQTVLTANLGKRGFNFLNGKVDFVMYFQNPTSQSEHRLINMTPVLGRVSKSRYPHMNRAFRNHKDDPKKTWDEMKAQFATAAEQSKPA